MVSVSHVPRPTCQSENLTRYQQTMPSLQDTLASPAENSSSDWSDRTSRQGATSLGRATTFHTDHCWSENSRHNFNSERKFSLTLPTELTLTTTHSHHIYTWQTWSLFIFSSYTISSPILKGNLCCNSSYATDFVAQKLVEVKLDPFSVINFNPEPLLLTWESRAVSLRLT